MRPTTRSHARDGIAATPLTLIALDQIDANRFTLPGLLIDAYVKADSLALADFIAFAQVRDVEENVNATIVRFYETKASIAIEHLNFAGWHGSLNFSYDPLLADIR
jgi:hypothetical protein